MRLITATALPVVLLSARAALPCSVVGPLPRPEMLVVSASGIALARATPNAINGTVEFEIAEVLKGSIDSPLIRLDGTLTDQDDFNDAPAPMNSCVEGEDTAIVARVRIDPGPCTCCC